MKLNNEKILQWAKTTLDTEINGISEVKSHLNDNFIQATQLLVACKGKIVVTGMGKAGIIGQKFSATLSSTGSSSFWLHAGEAVHGDLGRICVNDTVVILSYSGETDEIKHLIPFIRKIGAKTIAITGNMRSTLAQYSDAAINVAVKKEACALGLAPTTSTTAMLAACDALAVVLQKIKGFKAKDFALFHPRGSLGRKLLLTVKDIMRKGKFNPIVKENTLVEQVLIRITQAHAGAAIVINNKKEIIGIFTDGDLRRNLKKHKDLIKKKVKDVMTKNPIVVRETDLASDVLKIFEKKKIDEIPVVNEKNMPVGMLDIQDLIKAGVV